MIRNVSKAIIIDGGRVLLNRHEGADIGVYYSMPGGGQNKYETIEECLVRECAEETGYSVVPGDCVAIYEEIYASEETRLNMPKHSHKVMHIFRCSLSGEERGEATETDSGQLGSEWVDIGALSSDKLVPPYVGENFIRLIETEHPIYLGTHYIESD